MLLVNLGFTTNHYIRWRVQKLKQRRVEVALSPREIKNNSLNGKFLKSKFKFSDIE